MSDDERPIRTNCELQTAILFKLGFWEHERWLLAFVGQLLSPGPSRFVRLRQDGIIVAKQPSGEWSDLGSFVEIAHEIRAVSKKIRLDADEHGILLGRLASLKWRK